MKTISLQITDKEFNLLGLTKEQMLFSEFKEFIEKQMIEKVSYNENTNGLIKQNFSALQLQTQGFKFNRDVANER